MNRAADDNLRAGHLALVVGHPACTGGMETFCRFLAGTAISAGWRLTVALSGENIYEPLAASHPEQINVERVDWIDRACAGDREYSVQRIRARRSWFRTHQPDVAVVVQSSNTPFRCAVLGARLAGTPVVVTHRTMPWPVETVPSRRHLFGLVPGIGLHAKRLVFKTWLTSLAASRIVYNSSAVRSEYEHIYRYPTHRGEVIRNAVLPFPAIATQWTSNKINVGFVGRIGSDKRLDVLLEALAAGDPSLHLVVYGEGADRPRLEALAARLGIAHRVAWRGVTKDIAAAYAEMDTVVLCSPRESSSNMVLEAMAAGKAIIATNTGGMPELVDHGCCGLLVPPLDVPALTAALDRLAVDANLRGQLGLKAQRKAMQDHHPRVIGRQWLTLLSQVARRECEGKPLELPGGLKPAAL